MYYHTKQLSKQICILQVFKNHDQLTQDWRILALCFFYFCQQFMVLCWHNFSNYLKKSKIKYEIKLQISCILSLFLFFCISSMYASMFAWHFNLWIGRHTVGQIPQNVKKPQTWCVCHWYGLFYFCLFVLFIL